MHFNVGAAAFEIKFISSSAKLFICLSEVEEKSQIGFAMSTISRLEFLLLRQQMK